MYLFTRCVNHATGRRARPRRCIAGRFMFLTELAFPTSLWVTLQLLAIGSLLLIVARRTRRYKCRKHRECRSDPCSAPPWTQPSARLTADSRIINHMGWKFARQFPTESGRFQTGDNKDGSNTYRMSDGVCLSNSQ